jgi:hypothetical protein
LPTRRRSTSASSNSQSGWELELGRADMVGSIAIAQSGFASAARSAELRNPIGQHCRYTLEKVVLAAVRKIPHYEGYCCAAGERWTATRDGDYSLCRRRLGRRGERQAVNGVASRVHREPPPARWKLVGRRRDVAHGAHRGLRDGRPPMRRLRRRCGPGHCRRCRILRGRPTTHR